MTAPNEQPAQPQHLPFHQPKVRLRWIAFALAVVGWWLSLQLFSASISKQPNPLMEATCGGGPDAAFDCNAVLRSPQGSLPLSKEGGLRMPVSVFGMAYFALVGLWCLFVGPTTRDRAAYHLLLLALVIVSVLKSLDYVRIMAFELRQWCVLCALVHVVNALLLIVLVWAWPRKKPAAPMQSHPTGRLALATTSAGLLAFVLHLSVALLMVFGAQTQRLSEAYRQITQDPAYVLWQFERQPVVDLPLRDDDVILGNPAAPHTVVLFSDLQCSACRIAHEALSEFLTTYGDHFRLVHRYFPQDPACNPLPDFQRGAHASACEAARACHAARVAGGRDAYLAMRDLLFERQQQLDDADLPAWAAELGIERAAFVEAYEAPATAEHVQRDIELGLSLELKAMPVVYFDGRKLGQGLGWRKETTWQQLLGVVPEEDGAPAEKPSGSTP
jgi:protein-disulfide isomerase/uncharacterized membrane protein